jgi:hypothetical protein
MALALFTAIALLAGQTPTEPPTPPKTDAPAAQGLGDAIPDPTSMKAAPPANPAAGDPAAGLGTTTREAMEDMVPEGAPAPDYEFVAWCHGALAGQIELDPLVEKDMDAIEGKAKAAERHAGDAAIAAQHKAYLSLYERALKAAEAASPSAIHPKGVEAELQGYKIWGPTRNKEPIWRMVDWGNWEVPPRCEKAAKRLYERSTLLGAALKPEAEALPAPAPEASK